MSTDSPRYVTREGFERLKTELHELKTVKRREVAEKIERAKELGDLSENAEYQDAKDELAFIEGHILQLENLVNNATVIAEPSHVDRVSVGSTVLANSDDRTVIYQIVGSNEADPKAGKISNESPLGQAFLGKRVGDEVELVTPGGLATYTITEIR